MTRRRRAPRKVAIPLPAEYSRAESPRRAARITDCGLPPTPIHAGNGPDSVCGTTSWFSRGARRSFSGSAEQLTDARDDLVAVQLDVGHELFVRQAWHAVLQVEPGGAKGAEGGGDLLCDGFG